MKKTSGTDASQAEAAPSAVRRLLWFAVLWAGGVACVLTVSEAMRALLGLS